MMSIPPAPLYRRSLFTAATAALVLLFLPTVIRSFISDRPDWAITELLINYQGGFVRRGLLGELLLRFCQATGISFFTASAALFACLFAGLITAMVWLLRPYAARFPVLAVMLILSPALLLFPVHEWPAYLRKESLIVALLLVHAIVTRRFLAEQMTVRQFAIFTVAVMAPALSVMMLIHEGQMAYLTPHVCMTFLGIMQRRLNWRLLGAYVLPSILAFVMVAKSGNAGMIAPILDSVRPVVPINPGSAGAIEALGWSLQKFMDISSRVMAYYTPFYLAAWVLSVLVPAVALGQIVKRYATNRSFLTGRWITLYIVLICAVPLPMLIVWADFGRLIHLMAFSVVAFLLAIPIAVPAPAAETDAPPRFWCSGVAAMLAVGYIAAWMLPHFEPPRPMIKPGLAYSARRTAIMLLQQKVDHKRAIPPVPLAPTPAVHPNAAPSPTTAPASPGSRTDANPHGHPPVTLTD